MERLSYRSTSIVDLQAELRERELLAAGRQHQAVRHEPGLRVTLLDLVFRRRPRR